ncbi:hypothetical protein [Streptomyces sp. NEAU-YJ-81]|uniref:hypothetical protein n=1 Tax=Streptomyces sp. NEAU-YJ-81 TaxID=2820288 RepID=UPI001ABD2F6E|nr:hypothetical protein [Streptomyces sp. NEAU-YJ-81]MBO3673999.1 hypothetical protein [Streptomyces sp. NEAU-YJ-81]
MPIPLHVLALHAIKDVVTVTTGELEWSCSDPLDPDARAQLPWGPGVYVWSSRLTHQVLYIGKASGKNGLRSRLGAQELRWVREGHEAVEAGADEAYMADHWESFNRVMVARDAVVWWAPTADAAAARQWERNLLQRAIRGTTTVPIVNGGAWWNRSAFWAAASSWAQAAAGRAAARRRADDLAQAG